MQKGSGKKWILVLLFTGTLINAIDRASLATANTAIANDLHLNMETMGLVLSAFGWTYLLFNLPMGWLCDKFGTKKVYGISALIWSLASALTGAVKGLSMLLFSRVMVGAGEAANFPAATKAIVDNFDESERGTATGIYLSGLRLGSAITPALMVALMLFFGNEAHPNWRIAFYVTGFGSLIWVVLWFLTFKNSKKRSQPLQSSVRTTSEQAPKMSLMQLLKYRNTWAIFFIKFFQDYLYYLFLTWLPGYLSTARHMDLKHVAFYATLPWIAGMLAQPLVGVISDRLVKRGYNVTRVKKTLIVISQLLSVSVIGAAYAGSAISAAVLLVITMAAESASTAILWSIPQDLAPEGSAGALGGLMNTAGAFASIVSPILTGFIAQRYGFASALVLGGSMMIAAALSVVFFLTKIRPLDMLKSELQIEPIAFNTKTAAKNSANLP
ncbi:MFS transporter [Aneurinibacillus sp. Ricciae_BoGa-3]|uniref:MFS transporter n=1 Tax=Aneurinibacillus sp. Ricciae_BoGa-3 TaxID=3022697 RepID=UPI002340810B|nr:MFS transporter [Aneurinibacillus sp. Ricciae_BoGa-3]WCK54168.1 MFS transporter [Aneurinibacillus sp. Ricciae_BoGa-3]